MPWKTSYDFCHYRAAESVSQLALKCITHKYTQNIPPPPFGFSSVFFTLQHFSVSTESCLFCTGFAQINIFTNSNSLILLPSSFPDSHCFTENKGSSTFNSLTEKLTVVCAAQHKGLDLPVTCRVPSSRSHAGKM